MEKEEILPKINNKEKELLRNKVIEANNQVQELKDAKDRIAQENEKLVEENKRLFEELEAIKYSRTYRIMQKIKKILGR